MPVIDPLALIENRVLALRAFHDDNRFHRAELDVSGGIDSAVMLQLLCRALDPERVTAVFTGIDSSEDSLRRARAAAASCGVRLVELEISDVFATLTRRALEAFAAADYDTAPIAAHIAADPTVLGSFRSCLRAPIGRGLNRMTGGGIRHGTGNECEDRFLRFYQKGGDGEVDSNPIAMLAKGEVFQLARALEVPHIVLAAIPSPDLHGTGAAHSDEAELRGLYGVAWTYSKVDPDTGEYTFVGSIERMSRLLDQPFVQARLLQSAPVHDAELDHLIATGLATCFAGFAADEVRELLLSARYAERATRHKSNPNCPTLGTRRELLDAGILTDALPEV
jgi:NAD+ synthetase